MGEKNRKSACLLGSLFLIVIFCFVFNSSFLFASPEKTFDVRPYVLKESILRGGEAVSNIVVENLGEENQTFNIYLYNLEGVAFIDEREFTLGAGESKTLPVLFKDVKSEIAVYVGHIVIESNEFTQEIPLVLGTESENPSFIILQETIPNYDEVYPGGRLGMEIKIFNINDSEKHDVKINYFLKNFNGDVLIPDEENRVIEDSVAITKIIKLPESIVEGDYVFVTFLENDEKSVASYYFEINKNPPKKFFGNIEYTVLIIVIFIIGMFGLLFYFFKSRDEVFIKLQKQQSDELRANFKIINGLEKSLYNVKDNSVRKKKLVQLKKEKKEIISGIKKRQKLQKKELKKLKSQKKKKEMIAKLSSWKKQGYSFPELKKKVRGFSESERKKKIESWRKQGYNLDDFNK